MSLHLTILGGGANAHLLLDGMANGDAHRGRSTGTGASGTLPMELTQLTYVRSSDARRDKELMDELVRIEKKHWDKGSSWGDQLPTLVSKKNAYLFVLLGPERPGEPDSTTCLALPVAQSGGTKSFYPISYAIVYVNALHAQLSKVFTLPAWRGRGVATCLVGLVLEAVGRLKKRAGYEVTLMVETDNLKAQAVYTRCGFRQEGTQVKDYYSLGRHAFRMVHVFG